MLLVKLKFLLKQPDEGCVGAFINECSVTFRLLYASFTQVNESVIVIETRS